MESKINLEELLLHQLDRTYEMKGRLEAKAVGFLAAVALIMGVLVDYAVKLNEIDVCPIFKWTCFSMDAMLFSLSLMLLIMTALTLKPVRTQYFEFNDLKKLCNDAINSNDDSSIANKEILDANETMVLENDTSIHKLEKNNKRVSIGVIVLAIGFVFESILFFVLLGVSI